MVKLQMKTVGFIGGYDKIDLILYIARILTLAKKKVLLIDTTVNQKAKYVVPSISPTRTYITNFEGFDVAVGFRNEEEIKQYLGIGEKPLGYDLVLVDIDTPDMFTSFNAIKNQYNCFVTAFDLYSLKRGLEVLSACTVPTKLIKVLFSKNMLKEENEYLDYLSLGYKVKWDKNIVNFPIELGNYSVTVENQIISRIKMKRLSDHYKDSLKYLIEMVFSEDVSSREISKIIKSLEKDG